METQNSREGVVYLEKFTSRKDERRGAGLPETSDSISSWVGRYLELAVVGVRSRTVAEKAALHLGRFVEFFQGAYGHDRISTLVRRDVQGWQRSLTERDLAPSTVNNHLASLSAFTTNLAVMCGTRGGTWSGRSRTVCGILPHPRRRGSRVEAETGKLRSGGRPRPFGTHSFVSQPCLFGLDALGEAGCLKALRPEGYAPRRPRGPLALRQPLFPCAEAL